MKVLHFPIVRKPSFKLERALFAAGRQSLAGLDEVGRGAWAGPVVAGAVLVTPEEVSDCRRQLWLVRDSKLLSERQRERAFAVISRRLRWGVGVVSHKELDRYGMSCANQWALDRAMSALPRVPDFLLVDGRGFFFQIAHRQIIDGDVSVFCIAAASIVAKVTRDRLMRAFVRQYPDYGFGHHKGYGTPEHQEALARHGPCSIHRRTFQPILNLIAEARNKE